MTQVSGFRRAVKIALIDRNMTQTQLAKEVSERTGLYVDGGYLAKIYSGKRHAPKIVAAICEILDIQNGEENGDNLRQN